MFFVFFRKMHIPLYETFFWNIWILHSFFLLHMYIHTDDSNTKIVILFESYNGRQKKCRKFRKQCSRKLNPTSVCTWLSPFHAQFVPKKEVLKKLHVSTHLKRDKNLFNCLLQQDAGLLNTVNLLKKQKV